MATQLRTIIGTIADSIAEDPGRAQVRLTVGNELVDGCEVDVAIGSHRVTVDQPVGLGGADAAPTPVEYALLALGSCVATTYRFWSEKLGMRLDQVRVDVSGDLDLRGMFGLDHTVRPGCSGVELRVTLGGPEAAASYEMLARTVDEHSPVLDLFAGGTPVTRTLTIG